MKKLVFLLALFAFTCSFALAQSPDRTPEGYAAMLEEYDSDLYGSYMLTDANINTVVDKDGNVVSMKYTKGSEIKAELKPEGSTVVLTIDQTDEYSPEEFTRLKYVFDDQLRLQDADLHFTQAYNEDDKEIHYTMKRTYNKDERKANSCYYNFVRGTHLPTPLVEMGAFPKYTPLVFAENEGVMLITDPETGQYSSMTFMGTGGKPKQTVFGFATVRFTYQAPNEEYNNRWESASAIQELQITELPNWVSTDEKVYYVSKTEFLDASGRLVNTVNGSAQAVIELQKRENGEEILNLKYLDKNGRLVNNQGDGYSFARIEYIANDSVTTASLYAADGTLAESAAGIARYCTKSIYNEKEISYWTNKAGKYVMLDHGNGIRYGYLAELYYNNKEGRRIRHTFYRGTSDADRVVCAEGYSDAIVTFNPNDSDETDSECYYGTDGKLVVNIDCGYAAKRYKYNNNNRLSEVAYFGVGNKPIEVKGIAREVYGYTNEENYSPDFTWYYNAAGEMITPDNMPKFKNDEYREQPTGMTEEIPVVFE